MRTAGRFDEGRRRGLELHEEVGLEAMLTAEESGDREGAASSIASSEEGHVDLGIREELPSR